MKKRYLHLSVYPCDLCTGPVIAGSTAVRENEISRETEIRTVGMPICLSCGHRQDNATAPVRVRHVLPISWEPTGPTDACLATAAFVEELNRAELH